MTTEDKERCIAELHDGGWSCVICSGAQMRTFGQRGVKDLLQLLHGEPELLRGAFVADKVVGKGAAALMVLGGVAELYADVISTPARQLLVQNGVKVEAATESPNIRNRAGDGICPVEALCADCTTAEECLPPIENFVAKMAAAAGMPKN